MTRLLILLLFATPAYAASADVPARVRIDNLREMSRMYGGEGMALAYCADHNLECPAVCERADNEERTVWCESANLCCDLVELPQYTDYEMCIQDMAVEGMDPANCMDLIEPAAGNEIQPVPPPDSDGLTTIDDNQFYGVE